MVLRIFDTDSIGPVGPVTHIDLGTTDSAWVLEGVTVGSEQNYTFDADGSDQTIHVDGTVTSQVPINMGGPATTNNKVYVGPTGSIISTQISSLTLPAISASGEFTVENHGLIWGADCGLILQGTALVTNRGTIWAVDFAVYAGDGDGLELRNNGSIESASGILGSDFDDSILNNGTIIGDIALQDGADFYRGTGSITGRIDSGGGADVLVGAAGKNDFLGGNDSDQLSGLAGADLLDGGAGSDTLGGGVGQDRLTGGAGNDFFVFDAPVTSAHRDVITDFNRAADTMRLENAVFKGLGGNGVLKADAFKLSTQVKDASDRIIYNKATGTVAFDPDGSGAKAAVVFATLTTKPTINHLDFVVI